MNKSLTKHAGKVGLFFIVLYAACLLWRLTMTDPDVINFHLLFLKTMFPGFSGFTAGSIVWGAALTFVYAFLGSLVFHSFHKDCCLPKS